VQVVLSFCLCGVFFNATHVFLGAIESAFTQVTEGRIGLSTQQQLTCFSFLFCYSRFPVFSDDAFLQNVAVFRTPRKLNHALLIPLMVIPDPLLFSTSRSPSH